MKRNRERAAVAREVYVGLVVAMRRQFLSEPGVEDLERLRDLAERAGAVWAGQGGEFDEYVLAEGQDAGNKENAS